MALRAGGTAVVAALAGVLTVPAALAAQAVKKAPAPGPVLQPGEAFVLTGPDGVPHAYGASQAEHPLGSLAKFVWLKFEGIDWAARGVGFKCKGGACTKPKGHGRVDLDAAVREDCSQAFLAWIEASADGWRRDYGEGVARTRLEEAFRPFLGKRMPAGDVLPELGAAWIGEGELLRATPETFMAWLNDPEQAELLSRCRRTLGSRSFHFKDLADVEDWWFQSGAGGWTVGGNGQVVAILHAPGARNGAEGIARFRTILGVRK